MQIETACSCVPRFPVFRARDVRLLHGAIAASGRDRPPRGRGGSILRPREQDATISIYVHALVAREPARFFQELDHLLFVFFAGSVSPVLVRSCVLRHLAQFEAPFLISSSNARLLPAMSGDACGGACCLCLCSHGDQTVRLASESRGISFTSILLKW